MLRQVAVFITVSLLFAGCSDSEPAPPPPPGNGADTAIDGEYRFLEGTRNGEALDTDALADGSVVIQDGLITTYDSNGTERYVTSFTLDTSTSPWEIVLTAVQTPSRTNADRETRGLVEQNQDTLTLVYALPGGEEPETLQAGEGQQLFQMQRVDG